MKKTVTWLTGLSLLSAGLALAEAPQISQARIDVVLKQVQAQLQGQPDAPKPNMASVKAEIVYNLQGSEILKAEALKAGLDKQPEVQAELENMQAKFYAGQYVDYLRSHIQIDDHDLYRQYELMTSEINLLLIPFSSREAAQEGLGKLKKGLGFEKLMQQVNPHAPNNQWINPQQLPPEIAQWVSQLSIGQISGSVMVMNGQYFLLKLAGTRHMANAPAFEQVKEQLRDQAKNAKIQHTIMELLQKNGLQP